MEKFSKEETDQLEVKYPLISRILGQVSLPNVFYYYRHDESDSYWKQRTREEDHGYEVEEITYDMYLRGLTSIGEVDGDHKIVLK